jgi:hypothetical protein
LSGRLFEPAGVFVSLHRHGFAAASARLRAIARFTRRVRDSPPRRRSRTRAPPVQVDEVDWWHRDLCYPPCGITPEQFVVPGLHGVSIVLATRGVFLPQVAPEAGWTARRSSNRPAGLPAPPDDPPPRSRSLRPRSSATASPARQSRGEGSPSQQAVTQTSISLR